MLKPSRLPALLLLAPALVASACGSTGSSTTSKTAAITASAPTGASSPTATQGATAPEAPSTTSPSAPAAPRTSSTPASTGAQTTPATQSTAPVKTAQTAKPSAEAPPLIPVPSGNVFPKMVRVKFLHTCSVAKGTPSSCECLLAEFEVDGSVKPLAIAEMAYLELAMQKTTAVPFSSFPRKVRKITAVCKSTIEYK